MQDRKGRGAQSPEGCIVVEVAGERHDAMGPQFGAVGSAPGESEEPDPAAQQKCRAQRDVTASDQQYPDHVPAPTNMRTVRTVQAACDCCKLA